MPTFHADVIFQHQSGLPKDQFVNGWHFESDIAPVITDYDNVRDMLDDFYTNAITAGVPIQNYLSEDLETTATVKLYALADSPPRSPVYESTFTLAPGGDGPLPLEVALCGSFQAEKVSGQPQRFRRNRVYLGPLGSNALAITGLPNPTFTAAIAGAFQDLWDAQSASVRWSWMVYSPSLQQIFTVHDAWVDNAWDTQRRRGLDPTARTTVVF